ncbi:DUF2812 domain-containing protein [Clostridium sp.]|uniref:DUF2812 domain-containing protein n=1 Tax=Clostridium sp. TaxID=1506 RepID=UPI0032177A80
MIKKFRVFLDPIEGQERWLNNIAKQGYKLESVSHRGCLYEFSKQKDIHYIYTVELVSNHSNEYIDNYIKELNDFGIKCFIKGSNIGQYSFGKVKLRPFIKERKSRVATSKNINRELLILEKRKENDEDKFEIYTDEEDINRYYSNMVSLFSYFTLIPSLFLLLVLYDVIWKANYNTLELKIILAIILFIFTIFWGYKSLYYKKKVQK